METELKKIRNYLMIDIGRGDQENFEKKKIVAKVHKKSVINPQNPDKPDENVQNHQFHSENLDRSGSVT